MEKFKLSRRNQIARNSSWWQAILDNFVDSMQVAGGGKTVIAQKHVEHDYKK